MTRFYLGFFSFLLLLMFGSCHSIEQISIDYLQPSELSFPPQLRRVAIVDNTLTAPDTILPPSTEKTPLPSGVIRQAVTYANGNVQTMMESLADEITRQNYFDKVVICDSPLRNNDQQVRENALSRQEILQLTADLDVDLIFAIERLPMKVTKSVCFINEFNCFASLTDVKVSPTVSIYLPERSKPMNVLHLSDSIFWENYGGTPNEAATRFLPDRQLLQESSDFAGTLPLKYLVPTWQKGTRYLYVGGSVPMRDAAVCLREEAWDDACQLWQQAFETSKSTKKKMRAAFNIAVYHEMKDSLEKAQEWAEQALQLAQKAEHKHQEEASTFIVDGTSDSYLIRLYLLELKKRNSQLPQLKMQMSRFENDF